MILDVVPEDLDDDISMRLSAEYRCKDKYGYEIVKLTIRNRHNGQQAKALQLITLKTEELEGPAK
jgi:hypothetical protein